MQSRDIAPGLVTGFNMRLQILLALTAAVSASKVLFKYEGNEDPTMFPGGKFHYLDAHYDEDNDEYIPQAHNGHLLPTPEGLIIECSPSQSTKSLLSPGAQFMLMTRSRFPIQSGKVGIEMTSKVQISGLEDHPFGDKVEDPQSEPRLASTSIGIHGMCGVVFSFVFTNRKIYASILKAPRKDAPSYSQYLIPLIDTAAGVEHTVKFVLDVDSKSVAWLIDGQQVYLWQQGTSIEIKYCILRDGENAEPEFPTGYIVPFVGIWSFWEELSSRKEELKENTVMLDSAAGEQAQNVVESTDKEWSPRVIFTIKNMTITQEL